MLIDDEPALQEWLVATLEPLCDAEPNAVARYVLALMKKDKPLDKLRENCIDRLDVFLDRATKDFVDQLFDVIRTRRYIPEAKKENVQPKGGESDDERSNEPSEQLDPQTSTSPNKDDAEHSQSTASSSNLPSSSEQITTVSQQSLGTIIQPVKRRYSYRSSSGRHHSPNPRRHVNSSTGGATRHQTSSHYRPSATSSSNNSRSHRSSSRSRSGSPPPAKRSQRSYSHSSTGSSSRSSPSRSNSPNRTAPATTTNANFLYKKLPCNAFFENKGYCPVGDSCPYDHGTNPNLFEQQQQHPPAIYSAYPPYGMPPAPLHHFHEYNPETPDMKHGPQQAPPLFLRHPMHHHHPRMHGPPLPTIPPGQPPVPQPPHLMMNPQRTLVTVVTNAEPLPLEQRIRPNDQMPMQNNPNAPMQHQKQHANTRGPYPNDRRPHQHHHHQQHHRHDQFTTNESNNNNNNTNINSSNTSGNPHHNQQQNNNGFNNRGWKRPWQKADGSGSSSATLEIRKIPVEFNTISKLNEHFSKFGTVTNVQIAYDGASDSALVAYATFQEAETAYKNPEPLFNNRFIKIFWHNSNKNQTQSSSTAAASASSNNNNNGATSSQGASTETSTTKKPMSNVPNPKKLHWIKAQQASGNKIELPSTLPVQTTTPAASTPAVPVPVPKKSTHIAPSLTKKDAAKKATLELHRKKQGLLEEQIQQQKILLKKLESAETSAEKDSIRALMKKIDATIVTIKDSLRLTTPVKSASNASVNKPTGPVAPVAPNKLSQQDILKKREETLKKQIENLRAKTSADMRRAMGNALTKSELNLPTVQEDQGASRNSQTNDQQLIVRNVQLPPSNDLETFLKKSGAKEIQSNKSDNSLLLTFQSKSDVEKIKKNGLIFEDHPLEISFHEESALNTSGKKRSLSETLEDELLGETSADATRDDNDDDRTDEPDAKRQNRSQTSDTDDHEENDEEERLLSLGDGKGLIVPNSSIGSEDNFNLTEDFEPNDLNDDDEEFRLLDS